MGKARPGCRLIVFSFFFGAAQVALSASAADPLIPPDHGYVLDAVAPASSTAATLIHLQEAHTNEDSQRHLIAILDQLVRDRHLKLILVEGGEGNLSLSYLRQYGPPDNRHAIAEKYLHLGILSAEEYLDIVSDHPLMLWGVEDDALYRRHVQAYQEIEALQPIVQPVVASWNAIIGESVARLADPNLTRLEQARRSFDAETITLAAYVNTLTELAQQQAYSLAAYPELARFHAAATETQVHPLMLSRELEALAEGLYDHLAVRSGHEALYMVAKHLGLLERLVALQLSPGEYQRAVAVHFQQALPTWPAAVGRPLPNVAVVQEAVPTLLQFYELASARDAALVQRTLAKLRETGEPLAVLITGGFHAPEITRRLREAGLGLVTAVPKIDQATDEARYRAILHYKNGDGSLDAVTALQPSTTTGAR